MSAITPFVKRMRTQGGTVYTFSSALEDIGLNINERNNEVAMSHFALLNIPSIDAPPNNLYQNRFNVLAIPGAFQSWQSSGSIKDGRVIVAESFQNYALNLENNLLHLDSYNPTLNTTISERVFWKWLKETGAIRWQKIDTSAGVYWQEETDTDSSLGYNSIVKCTGLISAGSMRTDNFGSYNETYVLVPTSYGQSPVYFKQVEDENYYHGLSVVNGAVNILGRETYLQPHPDALDFKAYYDLPDSSTIVGSYSYQQDNSVGYWSNGWWWSEDTNLSIEDENSYYVDSSSYKSTGIYNIDLQYAGSSTIAYRRSKVDCISIEYDLNNLKTIFNDPTLTFDKLAIENSIDDQFDFNAVLIYYTVYNKTLNTVLAVNLFGVLFLDPPSGNTSAYPLNEIVLPSITKLQSGPTGFGTSYSFRINIKSDYMFDDTQAIVTDTTSAQTDLESFSDVFDSLGQSVTILNRHTATINKITEQYLDITDNQTNILNRIEQLELLSDDIASDIQGTENAISMFSAGDDPLIDSSIFMKNGKIGFFNNNPTYPAQFDVSVKVKDLIIENAIRDTSGNILLGYGSPLQLGSSTNYREINFYVGSSTPALSIDISNNVLIPSLNTANFIKDSSLSNNFRWNAGFLEVSINASTVGLLKESSLGTEFSWVAGMLRVSTSGTGADIAYVDGSLNMRDTSINYLNTRRISNELRINTTDTSLLTLTNRHNKTEASLGWLKTYTDGSLGLRDTSIAWLNANKVPSNAPQFTNSISLGDFWKFELSGTSLLLKYNNVAKFKFTLDGSILAVGDITSRATI